MVLHGTHLSWLCVLALRPAAKACAMQPQSWFACSTVFLHSLNSDELIEKGLRGCLLPLSAAVQQPDLCCGLNTSQEEAAADTAGQCCSIGYVLSSKHSSILQVDLEKTWVMFSSIVLAFAFVFGNSVKTLYESIIYLFVVHPFDVGDKIIVDSVSSKVGPLSCQPTHHILLLELLINAANQCSTGVHVVYLDAGFKCSDELVVHPEDMLQSQ